MKPFLIRAPIHNIEIYESWSLLQYFNLYRTSLSALLVYLFYSGNLFVPLGSAHPTLFSQTVSGYLILSLLFWFQILSRIPRYILQVYIQILSDILAISLLVHASGGLDSGLGTLMVVSVAAGSILLAGRTALLFAAIAAMSILGEQLYSNYIHFELHARTTSYPFAGSLGIAFFATAILTQILARRIRESEALARKHSIDLENMAQLTEAIIQRMQTGILVVDRDDHIRLMNESAWNMLGMPAAGGNPNLGTIALELQKALTRWRKDPMLPVQVVRPAPNHVDIMPRFSRISSDARSGVLIYLEDTAAMAQQAQQLQLASLGRLTAGIAHEIRNPLGAISHAGQLLKESEHLDKPDRRLLQIIDDHTQRLNQIIENIMQISRRQPSHIERFNLQKFLKRFIADYCTGQGISPLLFDIQVEPHDMEIRFDTSHLQQILVNLCDNGLRYSANYKENPRVEIRAGLSQEFSRPYLDVIDHGYGIQEENARHLFEPFFTTEATGTGLGLYLSRQLAECNQAHLSYIRMTMEGTCFRLTFQDPRREIT